MGGPEADAAVARDMQWATELVMQRFRPISFILLGSFGRGEGRAYIEGAKLHYVSDVETAIVAWRSPGKARLDQLSRDISDRLNADFKVYFSPRLRFFLHRTRIARYRMDRPTVATYDMRYGSQCLAGHDFVSRLPRCEATNIRKGEAVRLVANRLAEGIISGDGGAWPQSKADKLTLAFGDAYLLMGQGYALTMKERLMRLKARQYPGVEEYDLAYQRRGLPSQGEIDLPQVEAIVQKGMDWFSCEARTVGARDFLKPNYTDRASTAPLPETVWRVLLNRKLRGVLEAGPRPEWRFYLRLLHLRHRLDSSPSDPLLQAWTRMFN